MNKKIHLGEQAAYPEHYDPELLVAIARKKSRATLGLVEGHHFFGQDLWTAYEMSWLDTRGKPYVAMAQFVFDANSPNIIESKSFKYYLNSYNEARFDDMASVKTLLEADLSSCSGGVVGVDLVALDGGCAIAEPGGLCVDDLAIAITAYEPDASLLKTKTNTVEHFQMYSHLLKSNCPVTGQPDWATVWVEYSGAEIDPASFLRYIVSFRRHQDFHESCVERIFTDTLDRCSPASLCVYARYTRRGGLDINPLRSTHPRDIPFGRLSRQ